MFGVGGVDDVEFVDELAVSINQKRIFRPEVCSKLTGCFWIIHGHDQEFAVIDG